MTIYDLKEYEILDEHRVEDVASDGYILRHKKSGARVAVLSNNDDNKVFYIAFRTTPDDETGVPHIIEHTTLCGSKKFPVKDPFIELAKGSLNTFLNAMTYPDKTVYPIASCNDKDFKNLMDVYMDAVFNPNITKYEEIFKQEGWHYELESKDEEITINGVVYNEMKGAYSSPEEVLSTAVYKALFPDNTYSKDSGGNPKYIPTLTYEDYLAFYHKYYHPSNSYIYLYGDMDIAERLAWLDSEYLSKYDFLEVDSQIQPQKPFEEVKTVEETYSIASDDSVEDKTYLAYSRVVGDSLDAMLTQAFDVLDYALVSSQGAPIKKALIDAGIGDDVSGSYDSGICQPTYTIAVKNANANQKDEFEKIITDTLKDVVANGLNKESLLAAINSSEFKFREADFGQFPKGLLYGLSCMDSWLFDDMKPFLQIECLDTYAKLREAIDTDYYTQLIEKYLLSNTHGATVIVSPQPGKNAAQENELKEKLKAYKDSLSDAQIEKLIEDTKHLRQYQEEPSSEEDLKKIPMLSREDIKKEALPFSNIEENVGDFKAVRHEVDTNGIDYVTIYFDAEDIAVEDISYLGFFASVLGLVNTEKYSYRDLANAINIYTGGISQKVSSYNKDNDSKDFMFKYNIKFSVLEENLEKALELVDQIIRTSDFSDTDRLKEIAMQIKARAQSSLSSSGHLVAAMRSMSSFSRNSLYSDKLRGIEFYRNLLQIEKQLEDEPKKVVSKLNSFKEQFFAKNRVLTSFTGKEEAFRKAAPLLEKYLSGLKDNSPVGALPPVTYNDPKEAFTDASMIQYVARTGNFSDKGFKENGSVGVLRTILSYDYLWINVRVKGGAYGCMNAFHRNGTCYFVSYRDPKLRETNEIFEKLPEYIRSFSPDERDMTKYIIGTFSSIDTPLTPEAKGTRSMSAYLTGDTYEEAQRRRTEALNTTPKDIQALADLVAAALSDDRLCVIGNENAIADASDMFNVTEKLIPEV